MIGYSIIQVLPDLGCCCPGPAPRLRLSSDLLPFPSRSSLLHLSLTLVQCHVAVIMGCFRYCFMRIIVAVRSFTWWRCVLMVYIKLFYLFDNKCVLSAIVFLFVCVCYEWHLSITFRLRNHLASCCSYYVADVVVKAHDWNQQPLKLRTTLAQFFVPWSLCYSA